MHKNTTGDEALIAKISRQPNEGMAELMEIYSGLVYYIVSGKLKDRKQDIEECVSDVFIEFYNNLEAIDLEKGSIKGYLGVIASRRAIDRFRRLVKSQETTDVDMENDQQTDKISELPEGAALDKEKAEVILQEIKNLGEPDDEIIYRRYYLSQPVKEIAQSLGMKSNTVTKRIGRALETLKSRLEEYHYE